MCKNTEVELGKQTAIHEQVLNTQSTDELMDLLRIGRLVMTGMSMTPGDTVGPNAR
ncbi:MAG: hypothetical protein CM15mP74_28400 [Halieaceae bacterium]|nr:MAG: hypothetical protein CM15mP74_28400 [Halieaceae bacterium]